MKISPKSLLAAGVIVIGAAAYPVANSLAVSAKPIANPTVTETMPCSMSAAKEMGTEAAAVPSISQIALTKAIADKSATVIDVNGTDSYKSGHIPSAVDFYADKDWKSALPKDKSALVVAYCGSESCGAYRQAAEAAMKLGYTNVQHFSPGIKGWKESGAAVEKA